MMTNHRSNGASSPLTGHRLGGAGAVAGLVGTGVMVAMRLFDQKYAPTTMPEAREDPGQFIVRRTESATGLPGYLPKPAEVGGGVLLSTSYGILAGALYAKVRGHRRSTSALLDGGFIGMALYLLGYAGWLPLLRLTRPIWKQHFPEIAGEALRHVAFGITTAAVYGAINDRPR
jgi:hypothetical protein